MSFSSLMGPRGNRMTRAFLYSLVVVCLAVFGFFVAVGADMTVAVRSLTAAENSVHEEVVGVLQDSISLLKWVGGGVVTALVSAIGLLYRSLERSNEKARADLMDQLKKREEILTKYVSSTDQVTERVADMSEQVGALASEIRRAHPDVATKE